MNWPVSYSIWAFLLARSSSYSLEFSMQQQNKQKTRVATIKIATTIIKTVQSNTVQITPKTTIFVLKMSFKVRASSATDLTWAGSSLICKSWSSMGSEASLCLLLARNAFYIIFMPSNLSKSPAFWFTTFYESWLFLLVTASDVVISRLKIKFISKLFLAILF